MMNVLIPEILLKTLRKRVENLPKYIIKISFMEEKKGEIIGVTVLQVYVIGRK